MTTYRSQIWVIAYDTPSDRRRRKFAKLLKGYGLRVQWSVFECELRGDQLQQLRQRLERLIVAEQDSVRFWRVPEQGCAQRQHLGRTAPSPNGRTASSERAALAEVRTPDSTWSCALHCSARVLRVFHRVDNRRFQTHNWAARKCLRVPLRRNGSWSRGVANPW